MNLGGRNNPFGTKIKLGMNLAGRNNPYSTKEQDKDESGRRK